MAEFNLTDAFWSFDGVDLSSYVREGTWTEGAETTDATAMGDTYRSASGSLKNASCAVTFHEDLEASAGPYQTLNATVGTTITVIYGAGGSTASATNPHKSCSMVITEYNPPGGAVGDRALSSVAATAAGAVSEVTS